MPVDADRAVIVRASRIHTMDTTGRGAVDGVGGAAEAVLVVNGRVRGVGTGDALRRQAPRAEVIDLPGTTVTPGLTDAHVHLIEWALARREVDLTGTATPAEAARRVADRATSGVGWVRGRGWDPHRWNESPHRDHLDRHVLDRPVLLQSHDMHSLWGNGAALWAAGIDRDTPDPPGGRIDRDAEGRPTGVVRDNAMTLLLRAAPERGWEERRTALLEAQPLLHRAGVTGVHTVEPDSLGLLEAVRAADDLRLRVLQHLALDHVEDAIRLGLRSGFGGPWIRIGGVKMFLDGALGSRTALMREPYERSEDCGVATLDPDVFRDGVRAAAAAGLASTVHAIGDAANDLALDVLADPGSRLDGPVPHRIEHVQLLAPERLGRRVGADPAPDDATGAAEPHPGLARVVCSVQPSHLMTDWRAADHHWGRRARFAYAFRSMTDAGATLALGSDAPVEPPDPRQGLYAAVVRSDLRGAPSEGWYPEERITPFEALVGYTVGAARAAGDRRQGRIAPGSFADLVAWDRDPLDLESEELLHMSCVWAMVGGEVIWSG